MQKINFYLLILLLPFVSLGQHSLVEVARLLRTNYLQPGGGLNLNLTGRGMTLHIYDIGRPLVTHPEFGNRLAEFDYKESTKPGEHASLVCGIALAAGLRAGTKGMAYEAFGRCTSANSDITDLLSDNLPLASLLVSNHSYGLSGTVMTANPWFFGAYNKEAHDLDVAANKRPGWLCVTTAGNDGDLDGSDEETNPNARAHGYDLLPAGFGTAKNSLTVASAENVEVDGMGHYIDGEAGQASNAGPTADLRIKPDICGIGDPQISCGKTPTSYIPAEGTSMAAPGVSGSMLLLQEYYSDLYGVYMRAATLKGLVLTTADDLDGNGRPDAISGWGLLNSKYAAEVIRDRRSNISTYMEELVLKEGEIHTISVPSLGKRPITASISWTDPAGMAVEGVVNSITPVLVNDLDLRIISQSASYAPYKLIGVGNNQTGIGDNKVDPFEKIDVQITKKGYYDITIMHKNHLQGGQQKYSLIILGMEDDCESDNRYSGAIKSGLLVKRKNIEFDGEVDNAKRGPGVDATATNQIMLGNGFLVDPGASFHASIAGCTGNTGIVASATNNKNISQGPLTVLTVDSSELRKKELSGIKLSPNPARDIVKITSSKKYIKDLKIYGMDGRLFANSSYLGQSRTEINIDRLPAGTYLATIMMTDGSMYQEKFVKE